MTTRPQGGLDKPDIKETIGQGVGVEWEKKTPDIDGTRCMG